MLRPSVCCSSSWQPNKRREKLEALFFLKDKDTFSVFFEVLQFTSNLLITA